MKITNVMAVSLDGKIGLHHDESDADRRAYGFTNEEDRANVAMLLEDADAVVTGGQSLRAGGVWNIRNKKGKAVAWVVATQAGIAESHDFWKERQIPRWLVTSRRNFPFDPKTGVQIFEYGDANVAASIYRLLEKEGFEKVLLFGGGEINRLFYREDLVDELVVTICPIILGSAGAAQFVNAGLSNPRNLQLLTVRNAGDYLFAKYRVLRGAHQIPLK